MLPGDMVFQSIYTGVVTAAEGMVITRRVLLLRVYYNHFWTLKNVHSLGTAKDLLHLLRHVSSEVLRLSFSEDLGSSG